MHITDFYRVLLEEARLSKDPHRKVCAVAFDSKLNRIASGWNGVPRGLEDSPERYEKPLKQYFVVHAEANLVASAARLGARLDGSLVMLTEWQPCAQCAGLLIQAGVSEVWFPAMASRPVGPHWESNFAAALTMLNEANIRVESFDVDSFGKRILR